MNAGVLSWLRLISLAILVWVGCRWLSRVHVLLVVAVVILAVCNLLAVWIIRYAPRLREKLAAKPVLGRYLRFIGWSVGERSGASSQTATANASKQRQLQTLRDFQIAATRAKHIVRGQDAVIDRILQRIHESITLRTRRREGSGQLPLASFLLVGAEGVGKQYVARVIAKLLYREPGTLVFDCEELTAGTLVGTPENPGELVTALAENPHRLILFDEVDRAKPEVMSQLRSLLTRGTVSTPSADFSLAQATLVLTTTAGGDQMAALADEQFVEAVWHKRAAEALAAETSLEPALLNAVSDTLFCPTPDDLVKAEVVSLLMQQEAQAHGVSLSQIEPEIVASQVVQIDDESGFAFVPQRVRHLLRRPLMAAVEADHKTLSLRVRWPEVLPKETAP